MKNLPMSTKSKYKQGIIKVTKEDGYIGSKDSIRIMSSFERVAVNLLIKLYKAKRIKGWVSEETIIPYVYTVDQKSHRYFIDFTVILPDDSVVLIEVKPESQLNPPKQPKKGLTESYKQATMDFLKNKDKWRATKKLCEEWTRKKGKQHRFVIWTEKVLGI